MNISARKALARVLAPANSFQTKMPQRAATMGADWPMEYEMATPVKLAATRLKTVPVVHMAPPTRPRTWPLTGPRKNPLNATGSPTSGFFMKYKFHHRHESSAPPVRKTEIG